MTSIRQNVTNLVGVQRCFCCVLQMSLSMSPSHRSLVQHQDKVSITRCDVGDVVLLCRDERHDHYVVFNMGNILHFLHSECLDGLGLKIGEYCICLSLCLMWVFFLPLLLSVSLLLVLSLSLSLFSISLPERSWDCCSSILWTPVPYQLRWKSVPLIPRTLIHKRVHNKYHHPDIHTHWRTNVQTPPFRCAPQNNVNTHISRDLLKWN